MAGKRTKTESMVGKGEIPTKENTLDPKIEKLIALGKKQGSITYKDVQDSLASEEMTAEQIEEMYDTLAEYGVEVEPEDYAARQHRSR